MRKLCLVISPHKCVLRFFLYSFTKTGEGLTHLLMFNVVTKTK